MLVCVRAAEMAAGYRPDHTHISWLTSSPALKAALHLADNNFARIEFQFDYFTYHACLTST